MEYNIILPEWEEHTAVAEINKVVESLTAKERKKLEKSIKKQSKLISDAFTYQT